MLSLVRCDTLSAEVVCCDDEQDGWMKWIELCENTGVTFFCSVAMVSSRGCSPSPDTHTINTSLDCPTGLVLTCLCYEIPACLFGAFC